MSVLPDFEHYRPASIEDVLSLLSFDRVPYAGGTELLLAMRSGLIRPDALVDLKRVAALSGLALDSGEICIGGSVTHQTVAEDDRVRAELPELAEVLNRVGNPRVRAAGTLGGNLCFAEPKSDVAIILEALEATVRLQSLGGVRAVPMAEFIIGPYATQREPEELLTEITIPLRGGRAVTYAKHQTMERPTVGVAGAITSEGRVRLVIGAAGPTPVTYEFSDLSEVDPADVASQVEVIPDMTGSVEYKRHIVALYLRRTCESLRSRI